MPKQGPKQRPAEGLERRLALAVIGPGSCDESLGRLAFDVGGEIARRGAVLLCGGRGGVMQHAAAGARREGGLTIGVLPGRSESESPPNESIDVPIFTGLGQARNQVLVLSAQAVIAVGGGWGTLSEIGLAMKHGIPVVLLGSWRLSDPTHHLEASLETADTAAGAVATALETLDRNARARRLLQEPARTPQEPHR